MTRRQSIGAALKSANIRRALGCLVGCPAGGWGETQQARRQVIEEIPHRELRSYSVDELISAALVLDHADRYRWRDEAAS